MKLKREEGTDGKGVVLKNVKYFGAQNNDGFEMYRSLEHSANVQGHKFSYADRNAFLISIDTHEGELVVGCRISEDWWVKDLFAINWPPIHR